MAILDTHKGDLQKGCLFSNLFRYIDDISTAMDHLYIEKNYMYT